MRKLFFIILVLSPLIFLSGCLEDDGKVATISFDANSGKYRDDTTVKYGYYPDPNIYPGLPCVRDADFERWCAGNYPNKDGHLFIDWKSNKDGSGLSFSTTNINSLGSGVVFYAQWIPDNEGYTLHFDTGAPNLSIPDMTGVSPNTTVVLPNRADVLREDYKLLGWKLEYFSSPGISLRRIYTESFQLSGYSLKDVYLEAVWYTMPKVSDDICTVNFDIRGGVLDDPSISAQQVACGSEIAIPSATKDGHPVSGWFSHDYYMTFAHPGKYPVMRDTTLYAVWDNDSLY